MQQHWHTDPWSKANIATRDFAPLWSTSFPGLLDRHEALPERAVACE